MDVLGAVSNAVLLILVGTLLSWQLNGRFKIVEDRFKAVDDRFNAVDDRFRAIEARLDTLQGSVDGIRSDLTQVALAVGTKRETGAGA